MTQTRKTAVLVTLLALWAGIFIFQYNQSGQKHQPLKYKKGETPAGVPARDPSPGSGIRLDLLNSSRKNLEITKNIFAPIYVPPPKPPAPPPPPPPVVLPPPPSPEEIARAQATQFLSQFKYLGYLNKGTGKEQGFFSNGGELYIVGKGDLVTGTIILKEIDPNQAVLKDKQTGVETTLILSD